MICSIKQLLEVLPVLSKMADFKMPAKTAFKVYKLIKAISSETDNFFKVRNELVQKYGIENENGIWQVTAENMSVFRDEVSVLVDFEVEISFSHFSIADFDEVILTPKELFILEPFLTE
jgi:nitric oxide synthase oxygenase domain/subunit